MFEKNRFPGDPQKHFGNSSRLGPLQRERPESTSSKTVFSLSRGFSFLALLNTLGVEVWTLLRLRNSAQAFARGGVVFCIQSSFKFVSLVFQTKFVSTGKCEKYRFHGESSQNWRVHVFCSSRFPRLPVRSAFLCGSHHVLECRRAVRVLPRRYDQSCCRPWPGSRLQHI